MKELQNQLKLNNEIKEFECMEMTNEEKETEIKDKKKNHENSNNNGSIISNNKLSNNEEISQTYDYFDIIENTENIGDIEEESNEENTSIDLFKILPVSIIIKKKTK